MGKAKAKKSKSTLEPLPHLDYGDADTNQPNTVKAIDGHNTQGWTDNEIKAYNELIVERHKLEKQRQELEEKCAKSQTQRALLHENVASIDSLFKQQSSMPAVFKFTGSSSCCVELNAVARCHHEICRRAKSVGVSDIEIDTIKYYSMRMHAEKSERVRNALRKQRDLELIRIKKEEEEGLAQNTKKASKNPKTNHGDIPNANARGIRGNEITKAAKETEKIVNKIIHQLDDLRTDLQTGRISAQEAQGKLNVLDSKLPAIQDKAMLRTAIDGGIPTMTAQNIKSSTEAFQNHLRERLLKTKGDTFTQAFSIMDHFLSATKPDDLQEAISNLKDVLQLSGPMCNELQSSLSALEGIFDSPEKLSFTGPDGKQECNSIIDLMEKLKDTLKRTGQLPDGANASLTKVFQECIDLEAEAEAQLIAKCNEASVGNIDLLAKLIEIRERFVTRSPIPPLTSNKLDSNITNLLDIHDTRNLLERASAGVKMTELEAQITSLVITRTQRQSAKYVEKLERLELACRSSNRQKGSELLEQAITNVLVKMKKWIPASELKKEKPLKPTNNSVTYPTSNNNLVQISKSVTPSTSTAKSTVPGSADHTMSDESQREEASKVAQRALRSTIEQNGKHGLWHTFDTYGRNTSFQISMTMLDKVESYKAQTRNMIDNPAIDFVAIVCYLYKLKLCPGLTAVLISQSLVDIADSSEDNIRLYMNQLSQCISSLPANVSTEWSDVFRHLLLAMIQLYVTVYVETMAVFPNMSAAYFALSVMEWVSNCVLLTKSSRASLENIKVLTSFLLACFSEDSKRRLPNLQDAIIHYRHFCVNDKFKCMSTGPCSKHMQFARPPILPFSSHSTKAPVMSNMDCVSEKEMQRLRGGHITEKDINISHHKVDCVVSGVKASRERIRPRKTVVTYPYRRQVNQDGKLDSKPNNIRPAQNSEIINRNCAATTKNVLTILRQRVAEYKSQKAVPPIALLAAMDGILACTEADYYHPIEHREQSDVDINSRNSKFSEHLDTPQDITERAIQDVLRMQNVFKCLRNGTLGAGYLQCAMVTLREQALSGQYANPIDAVARYTNSVQKFASIPKSFATALRMARTDVQETLNSAAEQITYQTRRLQYLLDTVGATEPSTWALYRLALDDPSSFNEYHEIISHKFNGGGSVGAEQLALYWGDIEQMATTTMLRQDSPSLVKFCEHAIENWSRRPREITKYAPQVKSDLEEDCDIDVSNIATVVRKAVQMMDRPTKHMISESGSPKPASVASQDLVLSSESFVSSKQEHEVPQILSDELIHEITASNEKPVKVEPTGRESENILPPGSGNEDESSVKKHLTTNEHRLEDADNAKQTNHDAEPQYLLPEDEMAHHVSSLMDDEEGNMTTSTPASFRMLDMMKHLTALQRNSKEMFETAEIITKLNPEHGKIVKGLADKLALQVRGYTDFVEQIARWNGVELAKEGFEVSHSGK